jgi:hypothetical protein
MDNPIGIYVERDMIGKGMGSTGNLLDPEGYIPYLDANFCFLNWPSLEDEDANGRITNWGPPIRALKPGEFGEGGRDLARPPHLIASAASTRSDARKSAEIAWMAIRRNELRAGGLASWFGNVTTAPQETVLRNFTLSWDYFMNVNPTTKRIINAMRWDSFPFKHASMAYRLYRGTETNKTALIADYVAGRQDYNAFTGAFLPPPFEAPQPDPEVWQGDVDSDVGYFFVIPSIQRLLLYFDINITEAIGSLGDPEKYWSQLDKTTQAQQWWLRWIFPTPYGSEVEYLTRPQLIPRNCCRMWLTLSAGSITFEHS